MYENISESFIGEQGHALTVFRSPVIERIDVNIITVIPRGSFFGTDIILGRVSGPPIDRIGGVPFGTSGSPVFVNGELIGAIAFIFVNDFTLVGITPVEAIRSLEFEPSPHNQFPPNLQQEQEQVTASPVNNRNALMLPVVSGLSSARAISELKKHLPFDFTPAPLFNRQKTMQMSIIEQGEPIGVALMTGDIRIGFIGTATLIENNCVFAFGHSIFFSGSTNLPLTESIVYDTARGLTPVKIGDLGEIIGTAIQDRRTGIFGRLDVFPSIAKLNYAVEDLDRRETETLRAQATRFRFLPFLSFIAALEIFDRGINRIGQGTARWRLVIHLENIPAPIVMQREEFDPFDISFKVALSVLDLVGAVVGQGLLITGIELTGSVETRRTVFSPASSINSPVQLTNYSENTNPIL